MFGVDFGKSAIKPSLSQILIKVQSLRVIGYSTLIISTLSVKITSIIK